MKHFFVADFRLNSTRIFGLFSLLLYFEFLFSRNKIQVEKLEIRKMFIRVFWFVVFVWFFYGEGWRRILFILVFVATVFLVFDSFSLFLLLFVCIMILSHSFWGRRNGVMFLEREHSQKKIVYMKWQWEKWKKSKGGWCKILISMAHSFNLWASLCFFSPLQFLLWEKHKKKEPEVLHTCEFCHFIFCDVFWCFGTAFPKLIT